MFFIAVLGLEAKNDFVSKKKIQKRIPKVLTSLKSSAGLDLDNIEKWEEPVQDQDGSPNDFQIHHLVINQMLTPET